MGVQMDLSLEILPADTLVTPRFRRALALLLEANSYTERTSADPWEFAVEINLLRKLGLLDNDLRFLIKMQYVDHGHEVTKLGGDGRQFKPTGGLSFTNRTCFVLTLSGVQTVSYYLGIAAERNPHRGRVVYAARTVSRPSISCLPVWDVERRALFFDGKIVKRFRRSAMNQEIILAAFQEEAWPTRIDDPLTPQPCQDMKRRLSDTIKCLNRGHENCLFRFRGDGTGEGVLWEAAVEIAQE